MTEIQSMVRLSRLMAETEAPPVKAAPPMHAQRELSRNAGSSGITGRLIREPLVHFVLLGAVLFGVWAAYGDRLSTDASRIVISAGEMARAIDTFSRTHLRSPDGAELRTIADQEIQDEVYFREGIALGLDRNDEIIRRRIRQKLLFLTQDMADQEKPVDAQLQAYLDQHRQDYGGEPDIAFSQIYLNPDRHKDMPGDAAKLLRQLNGADGRIDYAAASDTLPVSNDFELTPLPVIESVFGHAFAAALAKMPDMKGQWIGPISSGYGAHLVLIRQYREPKPPKLDEVRDAVLRDWQAERRNAVNDAAYREMRAKYRVTIELPKAGTN